MVPLFTNMSRVMVNAVVGVVLSANPPITAKKSGL